MSITLQQVTTLMIQSKPAHCNNESIEVLNWLSTEILLSLLKINVEILKWS